MSNNTKTVVGIIIALIVIVGGYSVLKNNKNKSGSTSSYKVGIMAPLTGDAASYGEPAVNIYNLALKQINDAGGVNGKPLELVIEDSKCDGQDGANAAQKLVNVDKVQVIIGGICSSESLAAIPIVESGKVALFSPAATSPDLTGKSRFFSRSSPSDSSQGTVLANAANSKGYKTSYAIVEQTDYAKGISKVFDDTFTSLGGKPTTEEFATGTNDLKPLVTKAKAANADVFVVVTQTPASADKIFKAMNDLNWKPKMIINDVPSGDPATVTANKSLLEGTLTAQIAVDPNNQTMNKLLSDYKNQYGKDMTFQEYGQTEYDAMFIVRDAIKAVGYDGAKIADWFRTIKGYQGAAGSTTIGSNGDPLSGHTLEVITNGQLQPAK